MACIFVFSCTVNANAALFFYYDIPYVNYKTPLMDSVPWDGGISDGIEGDGCFISRTFHVRPHGFSVDFNRFVIFVARTPSQTANNRRNGSQRQNFC